MAVRSRLGVLRLRRGLLEPRFVRLCPPFARWDEGEKRSVDRREHISRSATLWVAECNYQYPAPHTCE